MMSRKTAGRLARRVNMCSPSNQVAAATGTMSGAWGRPVGGGVESMEAPGRWAMAAATLVAVVVAAERRPDTTPEMAAMTSTSVAVVGRRRRSWGARVGAGAAGACSREEARRHWWVRVLKRAGGR